MPITDNLFYRLKAQSGETIPTDSIAGAQHTSGAGSVALVNDGTYGYLWRFTGKKSAAIAGSVQIGLVGETTVALRFKVSVSSSQAESYATIGNSNASERPYVIYNDAYGSEVRIHPSITHGSIYGPIFYNYVNDTVITAVIRYIGRDGSNDSVDIWNNNPGRSGDTPEYSASPDLFTYNRFFQEFEVGSSNATVDIIDAAFWSRGLTDAEAAALANDIRGQLDGSDVTAPTLTSVSVTSVGTTTATGSVTTNEGNGTLYSIVSTSATAPSAAQIQAGQDNTGTTAAWSGNQAVSSTGAKTFSITGLSNSTNYYAHFQHKDAANNNSTVATSAQFTTTASDTTVPTLTGSVTISAKTTTSYTATWPSGSDNVAVTGYEYRLNAGSWVDVGNVLTTNISTRTPGSTDTFEVRAYDAAGNKSTPALSVNVTLYIGTITIPAVKDWGTGNLKTGETGVQVDIHNISTGALVVRKTGQTTHATTGVCVVQDASIADATTYEVVTRFADGSKGMWDYTASLT